MDNLNSFLIVAVPVFLLNLISCTAGSLKTSFLLREAFFLSAMCAAIGSVAMMFSFQQTGPGAYVAVFLAMFIGTYVPPKVMKELEKDCLYVYYVTTPLEEGKVVKDIKVMADTISGIATQTNLLALNAAIEAARAGINAKVDS